MTYFNNHNISIVFFEKPSSTTYIPWYIKFISLLHINVISFKSHTV